MPSNLLTGLCLLLSVLCCRSDISLEQYEEMEQEAPEMVFQTRVSEDLEEHTPNIEKLIFVTPWNIAGGDLVIKYANKFDYVSPCWYDLSFSSDHIIIENDNLYNETFVKLLRQANPKVKILPRIYISSQQRALLHSIGSFESKFKQAIALIVKIVEKPKFDGLVWDTPFNTMLAGEQYLSIRNLIVQFVNSIRMNLMSNRLVFFNMANPMNHDLANDMFAILNVNGILIQNYDNDDYLGMIQTSLNWIKMIKVARHHVKTSFFLLLPFFSRRAGQGIDTKQIQRILQKEERVASRIDNGICTFYEYANRVQSFTPCYTYFKPAFKKIEEQENQVGFWEAGNGVENYFQFL